MMFKIGSLTGELFDGDNKKKRESVRRSSSESGFISFVVSGFTSSPIWPKLN